MIGGGGFRFTRERGKKNGGFGIKPRLEKLFERRASRSARDRGCLHHVVPPLLRKLQLRNEDARGLVALTPLLNEDAWGITKW